MKQQSHQKKYTLAASKELVLDVTGDKFWLINSTGDLQFSFDDGKAMDFTSGQRFRLLPGDTFQRVRVINPDTSSSVTFRFYAGTLDIDTIAPYTFVKPAPKYTRGLTYAVTTAADTSLINTNTRAGKTIPDSLSYMTVSNRSAGDYVLVKNAALEVVLAVPPLTAYNLETTDACKLRMEAGAGANITIGYFFNYDS